MSNDITFMHSCLADRAERMHATHTTCLMVYLSFIIYRLPDEPFFFGLVETLVFVPLKFCRTLSSFTEFC